MASDPMGVGPHFWLRHVLLHPHVFAAVCVTAGVLSDGPIHDGLLVLAVFFLGVGFGASLLARFATEVICRERSDRDAASLRREQP